MEETFAALDDKIRQISVHGETDSLCDIAEAVGLDFTLEGLVALAAEAERVGSIYHAKLYELGMLVLLWEYANALLQDVRRGL